MNKQKAQQSIETLISNFNKRIGGKAARRQYSVAKWQIEELTNLGLIDLMPADFGHGDAKVVIEAANATTGGFNAYGEGESWSNALQDAMNEEDVEEDDTEDFENEVVYSFEVAVDEYIDSVTVDGIEFHFDFVGDEIDVYIHGDYVFDYDDRVYVEVDGSAHTIKRIEYKDEYETMTINIFRDDIQKAKDHLQLFPSQLPVREWYTVEEMAAHHDVAKNTIYRILRDENRKAKLLPCALHTSPNNPRRGEWVIPGHLAESWQRSKRGRK